MAKKKIKRRMKAKVKRAICGTLSAVFMISAILVAAIPVPNLMAETDEKLVYPEVGYNLPEISDNEKIYTTGDGMFQFVYVRDTVSGSANKIAVIVGYSGDELDESTVEIPNDVEGYVILTYSQGTGQGYAASTQDGTPLYYLWTDTDPSVSDNDIPPEVVYKPCYYSDKEWHNYPDEKIFYMQGDEYYSIAGAPTEDKRRLKKADVKYISEKTIRTVKQSEDIYHWEFDTDNNNETNPAKRRGVFSRGGGNIVTLKTGGGLLGIGDYAFKNCANLASVSLGNGATSIGNYAFASCINLKDVNIHPDSRVEVIGAHAFDDCSMLKTFRMPSYTQQLGDYAFKDCVRLETFSFYSSGSEGEEEKESNLKVLGYGAFENCEKLMELDLPPRLTQNGAPLRLDTVAGCVNLRSITVNNLALTFGDEGKLNFGEFKKLVGDTFYFSGPGPKGIKPPVPTAEMHKTARLNSIAYKYYSTELDPPRWIYEKIIHSKDGTTDEEYQIRYGVDESNILQDFEMGSSVTEVEIPNSIGPYKVTKIGSSSFQAETKIKKIRIPSSIVEIEDYAFQGCYNLKDVIFAKSDELAIGEGAFNTQVKASGQSEDPPSGILEPPFLSFTGEVNPKAAPFAYATNPENNFNNPGQSVTYITFYSGWPTNLTIQYNDRTKFIELTDYPKYSELPTVSGSNYGYPDTTPEQKKAAEEAVLAYEAWLAGGDKPSQEHMTIIEATLLITIPNGVEAVAEGSFSARDAEGNPIADRVPNTDVQSVRMESIQSIPAYAFAGCEALQAVTMESTGAEDGEFIGDYAFEGCNKLTQVNLTPTLQEMGKRPFNLCKNLTHVNFRSSPNFICTDGIIFGLEDSKKKSIVQCLETRGAKTEPYVGNAYVMADELSGVTHIVQEAFMNCVVGAVDLSKTLIQDVPESCFENTPELYHVEIPTSATGIDAKAFKDSNFSSIVIPESVVYIDPLAFVNSDNTINRDVRAKCIIPSVGFTHADKYNWDTRESEHKKFYVVFYDSDKETILGDDYVRFGEDAILPEDPERKGHTFDGWLPEPIAVSTDMRVYATYTRTDEDFNAELHEVIFYAWDDEEEGYVEHDRQHIREGDNANTPEAPPAREGHLFHGWEPSYSNVTEDLKIYAQYKADPGPDRLNIIFYNYDDEVISHQKLFPGENAEAPVPPTREGYTFETWRPSNFTNVQKDLDIYSIYQKDVDGGGTDPNPDPPDPTDPNDPNGNNGQTYVVTVINGSGSGSYTKGSTVNIKAEEIKGKTFTNWATSSTDMTVSDLTNETASFLMPDHAVTIEAKYSSSTSGSGSASGGSSSGSGSVSGNSLKKPGTTVDISKTGFSNKDKASATVNGSSDNFVVKITDDEDARAAVERALLNEYGTLENIKYMAMDISLYDSTGKNKVLNTEKLSVNITIPIPDALVEYAGNNKPAGVVDDRLDKLTPKFTTIDGVPCISFVATHFSPYTIYVDTANLTAGTIQDGSPQTGDGLHPKWFLVIGLSALSLFMLGAATKKKKVLVEA